MHFHRRRNYFSRYYRAGAARFHQLSLHGRVNKRTKLALLTFPRPLRLIYIFLVNLSVLYKQVVRGRGVYLWLWLKEFK